MPNLSSDIKFLPGMGPKKAEVLKTELGIVTLEDLIYYFPFKYIDRSKFYTVSEVHPDLPYVQLRGKISNFALKGNGRTQYLTAVFSDTTGHLELVWFKGLKWITENLSTGKEYIVLGKAALYGSKLNIAHPETEDAEKFDPNLSGILEPAYNTTEKMKRAFVHSKAIFRFQQAAFRMLSAEFAETLPFYIREKYHLMPLREALFNVHFPQSNPQLKKARYRLIFEELFYIQLNLLKTKAFRTKKFKGYTFDKIGTCFNTFFNEKLPFQLTGAQKKVIKEIRKDLGSGMQCNRLLQGDVGSGKTLVALMSMLIALDNGFQACLMAPTEILAQQHFATISRFLSGMNISHALLTGNTKQKDRKILHEQLADGSLQILVGTHALIEDIVQFQNLGLVVIDEQHRFGVEQRARMWKKNDRPPHIIVMTATPIPRTLAMTVYGDLDISVINELPPGRKPIKTLHMFDSQRLRLFGLMREEIKKGRQIYVVYPLIKESEKFDYKDLEDGLESISRAFPPPEFAVSVVHGKMKSVEKEKAMQLFIRHVTQIMVATTVIEVGVDVPNASVMVIESAERFGLSQLHQLRGRVGRGAEMSYCYLMSSHKLSTEARKRLQIMTETTDGFKISEEDLKLRGPGDIEGTQQSGMPFDLKISNLVQDSEILALVRNVASDIVDVDFELSLPENEILGFQLKKLIRSSKNWSVVS